MIELPLDFISFVRIVAYLAALVLILSTLAGFMGRLVWFFELFSHFRLQYGLAFLPVAAAFLFLREYPAALISALFAIANLSLVFPLYQKSHRPKPSENPGQTPLEVHQHAGCPGKKTWRVVMCNVLRSSREYQRVTELICTTLPDFAALVEVDQEWMEALLPLKKDYPYWHCKLRDDNYGISMISRHPYEFTEVHTFGAPGAPSLLVRLCLEGTSVYVLAVHPPPPKSKSGLLHRNQQMQTITRFAATLENPLILVGDLNTTSWSPYFGDWLRWSNLRDSRAGFGAQPTWPADNPLLRVPIDHLLVSDGIEVHDRKVGPATGSDHFPVVMDFSFHTNSRKQEV